MLGALYFKSASGQNHTRGHAFYAVCLLRGIGVDKRPNEAYKLLSQGAEQGLAPVLSLGNPDCQNSLALLLDDPPDGLAKPADKEKAMELFRQAAEGGLPAAMTNLAQALRLQGKTEEADEWLSQHEVWRPREEMVAVIVDATHLDYKTALKAVKKSYK